MCSVFSAELAPGGLCFGFKSSLVELPSKALKVSAEVVDVAGASTNSKPPGPRARPRFQERESRSGSQHEMDSPRVGDSSLESPLARGGLESTVSYQLPVYGLLPPGWARLTVSRQGIIRVSAASCEMTGDRGGPVL